jgi:hypothetical protein
MNGRQIKTTSTTIVATATTPEKNMGHATAAATKSCQQSRCCEFTGDAPLGPVKTLVTSCRKEICIPRSDYVRAVNGQLAEVAEFAGHIAFDGAERRG